MRVVAGRYGGRRLEAPQGRNLRPTSERSREALFSILESGRRSEGRRLPQGARVLDAFAGTGALGIEAFSRGAASVCFLENAQESLTFLRRNLRGLEPSDALQVKGADVLKPPVAPAPSDLVLMDPPYDRSLAAPALTALADAGWIGPETLVVVETSNRELEHAPEGFILLDQRRYGRARLSFLRQDPVSLQD
ncbi:16S rRNA (guanine(966)-N(2))-methyltransferase RsmD [Aquibaculum arenosum]|uniref:16S rRNA (Guanine(966)-N(2))-methyltransferase RsmD n=1 Tax=Aquibaculum arenosum TaxID=3032591 RepID=A0ABT5YMX2_9PROT|nr:16S rRNA (guanine(966)-N(2))-methyltransferase RsmD [Fodinicurvata sp. CAU 1616]MDF2096290.1 16S rRNA (guanine(966)-N(2))-methyltransferase RsmD [Fodinicurvata sp. CAU 1616]